MIRFVVTIEEGEKGALLDINPSTKDPSMKEALIATVVHQRLGDLLKDLNENIPSVLMEGDAAISMVEKLRNE